MSISHSIKLCSQQQSLTQAISPVNTQTSELQMPRLYSSKFTSKLLTLPRLARRTDAAPGLGDNQSSGYLGLAC